MFKNQFITHSINGITVIGNRYGDPNFWRAYGFFQYGHHGYKYNAYSLTFHDSYKRYVNTANGRLFQTLVITFNARKGEPMEVVGFRIETHDAYWNKLVEYDSYKNARCE